MRKNKLTDDPCVPAELLASLGWPKPPTDIWQEPFDYFRGHCERIATPSEPTDISDFCDYFLDYQYMDVQRDLLHYALPKALEAWARRELKLRDSGKFKGDWHFEGMWDALAFRPVHPGLLNAEQYQAMTDFLVGVLVALMQKEKSLSFKGSYASAYDWVRLHATLIWLFPSVKQIWDKWWSFETPEMAICAIQWLSAFLYEDYDNPYFAPWTGSAGGGPPLIFESLHMPQKPAVSENVEYLRSMLIKDWAADALSRATATLSEHERAEKIQETLSEFSWRSILFEERVEKYITVLESQDASMIIGWEGI